MRAKDMFLGLCNQGWFGSIRRIKDSNLVGNYNISFTCFDVGDMGLLD